jgi:dolichyl-phosphate-mannose--protein O-mannosyl transferase
MELKDSRNLFPLIVSPHEVALAWFEVSLKTYERSIGDKQTLPGVTLFIETLEGFLVRLRELKVGLIKIVESEVEVIAAINEKYLTVAGQHDFDEKAQKEVRELQHVADMRASGIVVGLTRALDAQIKKIEEMLVRARVLQDKK